MSEEYTPAEKAKLVEFRGLMSEFLTTEAHKDDSFLIRWLRAQNLDVKKAGDMLRKHFEWRKANHVDGIVDRESPPEDILRENPIAWCVSTSGGCPVLLCPMGRHDTRKFLEKYGKEACTRYNIIFMEKLTKMLEAESAKHGRKITQIVQLIDLEGYSYGQVSSKLCRDFLIDMQKTFDAQYPEVLKCAVIVNAPKIFSVVFSLLKPFMSKSTLDKLVIHGPDKEDWKKAISESDLFPLENIPPHWGGTLKGHDEFCSGSEIWIHGYKNLQAFMNGLDESDAEYSVAVINARDNFTKEFYISETGTVLEWKFKTDSFDLGFQVSFRVGAEDGKPDKDKGADVIPYVRVESHKGSHVCDIAGKYLLTFDNTFSYVKSKTLLYKISVIQPDLDSPDSEFQECPEF